ncbi:chromate efflux transporter [Venatoribacter cucullus]|uniref:Chromate efflux transporter n=1 Tax=Venatoribacter cucullus TaxID=2661630 RepID=A0A9X7YMW3_9GAMM|nr:chromate efflux transporter [Venatoribacter cucullus]QQD24000.1 chromate efflux transporter [Venatoribacter cucullus]
MLAIRHTLEVFFTFLWLGCISFGGPAAHIGIFQREFVQRRQWLGNDDFSRLLALVQFLPGPASSQLGFAIGRVQAGLPGAVAAFIGFTLPSAALMLAFALGMLAGLGDQYSWLAGIMLGLKWLAVVVVADAVLTMNRNFCTDGFTRIIAAAMAALTLATGFMALGGLLLAALAGGLWWKPAQPSTATPATLPKPNGRSLLWLLPFAALPLLAVISSPVVDLINGFFYSGTLVFGGGHVVLPLLQQQFEQQLTADALLAGYALAQAMPGPLFTLATYLGAMLLPTAPVSGALLATLAVFLPGFLLLLAVQPYWHLLTRYPRIRAAVAAVNAAVVGLLFATFINPVLTSAGLWHYSSWQIVMPGLAMLGGVMALRWLKLPVWALVLLMIATGLVFQVITHS